eukprot:m.230946 g.230946  ORF g.230946 m.230946 type:complete len:245 (+) comp12137_c0_seq1:1164-1898(+)
MHSTGLDPSSFADSNMAASLRACLAILCIAGTTFGEPISPRAPPTVPHLDVPSCLTGRWAVATNYSLSSGKGPAAQKTTVMLCHTELALRVVEVAQDDNVISNSTQCQDHVWTTDAMEIMVAPGLDIPINYTEIDVSPKNALWVGSIYNPTGEAPDENASVVLPCTCGVEWNAERFDFGWVADLTIPFALINPGGGLVLDWRINFFRTDLGLNTTGLEYTCWSPTYHTPPEFHVPRYFGTMTLV